MKKYAIRWEFFPWNLFAPPISEKFLAMSVPYMKPPKYLWRDRELDVTTHEIESYDGGKITCFVLSPKGISKKAPCLVYLHGGGFVLEAAGYHYSNAMRYAKDVGCKVVFPLYRLAPKHPFPTFYEDCYAAFCWAFNKDLMAVYNLTAPYADVTNNVWTLDKLMSLASNVVADNGDNVWGPEDTYGMIGRGWEEVISMASACDLRFVDRDENDVYTIALENNSEKTLKAIQMLCDMYNGQYAYFAPPEEVARVPRAGKSFADGTALFTTTSSNVSGFRNLEFPFGVVPMPKFDEAQKEYRSLNWNGMMFVPVSVQNKDMVSDTLEMLAYYTAPVKTAYLEDLLGTKLADAPEDAEMLDIIWNSVVSDVGLIMAENKNINTILHLVPTLCIEGSINRFGSTMQQNTKAANKALSQMLDAASRN